MSSVVRLATAHRSVPARKLALLGTGVVGSAFVARYLRLQNAGLAFPDFAWLANSRALHPCEQSSLQALDEARQAAARPGGSPPPWAEVEALRGGDIVVDATASETVADWHSEWLSRGVHVVTANKLGRGGSLPRSQAIAHESARSGARYGDAATVGAGLPLLSSLRALVAGGDRLRHRLLHSRQCGVSQVPTRVCGGSGVGICEINATLSQCSR